MLREQLQVNLRELATHRWDGFEVEVIDSVEDYWQLMKSIFPIESIKRLVARKDFSAQLDSMNGGINKLILVNP